MRFLRRILLTSGTIITLFRRQRNTQSDSGHYNIVPYNITVSLSLSVPTLPPVYIFLIIVANNHLVYYTACYLWV